MHMYVPRRRLGHAALSSVVKLTQGTLERHHLETSGVTYANIKAPRAKMGLSLWNLFKVRALEGTDSIHLVLCLTSSTLANRRWDS